MRKRIDLAAYRPTDMSLAETASSLMRNTLMTKEELRAYHESIKDSEPPAGEKAPSLKELLDLREKAIEYSDPQALHDIWIPRALHEKIHTFRDAKQRFYDAQSGLLLAAEGSVVRKLEEKLMDGIFRGFDITPPEDFKGLLTSHFFDLASRSASLPLEGCVLLRVNNTRPEVRLFNR